MLRTPRADDSFVAVFLGRGNVFRFPTQIRGGFENQLLRNLRFVNVRATRRTNILDCFTILYWANLSVEPRGALSSNAISGLGVETRVAASWQTPALPLALDDKHWNRGGMNRPCRPRGPGLSPKSRSPTPASAHHHEKPNAGTTLTEYPATRRTGTAFL